MVNSDWNDWGLMVMMRIQLEFSLVLVISAHLTEMKKDEGWVAHWRVMVIVMVAIYEVN